MCGTLLVPYSLGSPYANVVLQKKTSVVFFFNGWGLSNTCHYYYESKSSNKCNRTCGRFADPWLGLDSLNVIFKSRPLKLMVCVFLLKTCS